MSSTPFAIREVNDTTFPHHAMSGHLDELLCSPESQPVRCVATAPGHVVVSVAGGKYLHAFSARTPSRRPSGRSETPDATSTDPPDAASETWTRQGRGRDVDAVFERARTSPRSRPEPDSNPETEPLVSERAAHLVGFHGASPAVRVVFVPATRRNGAGGAATPLALLAVQEDGGVAAWRWVGEAWDEAGRASTPASRESRRASDVGSGRAARRWRPCAAAAFAGGPPLVSPPFASAFVARHGVVTDAALFTSDEDGRLRVRLACLTSGAPRGYGDPAGGAPPTVVAIDVGFLDAVLGGGGSFDREGGGTGPLGNTAGTTEARRAGSFPTRKEPEALAPVPRADAILSAGGDEFWVVAGGLGRAFPVATRWSRVAGETRAIRRVDLDAAARAADAAAAAADGAGSAAAADQAAPGRLAFCLHDPSRELLAVTARGNVLCLSPGLRGVDAETRTTISRATRETHATRHVGRLRGFASDRGARAKTPISRANALVARGPFLYLARPDVDGGRKSPETAAFANARSKRDARAVSREPLRARSAARASASARVEAYHLSSGIALGTVPIPAPPPLARGSGGDETNEARLADDDDGRVVRLVDGGCGRALVLATAFDRATGVFVVVPPSVPATLARAYVGEDGNDGGRGGERVGAAERKTRETRVSATPSHRTQISKMASLRAARRECAWFGGALERLDASAALALAELEIGARARGRDLSALALFESETANATNGSDRVPDSPTRARVAEPALVLRARPRVARGDGAEADDAWRAVADATRAFFRETYPETPARESGKEEARFSSRDRPARVAAAFAAFSELGAAQAREVRGALRVGADAPEGDGGGGSAAADGRDGTTARTARRAGLAALDAAATVPDPDPDATGFATEGRDTLRAIARRVRDLRDAISRTEWDTDAETTATLDDFRDVAAFLSSATRDALGAPASAMEAAGALLAETTVVRGDEGTTDDGAEAFGAACACAYAARPRLAVWLVARAAARAAKAGVFQDARAAARVLATHALAVAPPVSDARAHDTAAATRAALLSLAGHQHAATWLLLTRGAAASEEEAGAEKMDEKGTRERKTRRAARTSSRGWVSAARLVVGEDAGVDLAAAGGIFETLVSALRHVARRRARRENEDENGNGNGNGNGNDANVCASLRGAEADVEADAEAAARHTLRAAMTLAEAMKRPREGTRARTRSKDTPEKVVSLEPGTDALERLVAAAASRLAATTEALENDVTQ